MVKYICEAPLHCKAEFCSINLPKQELGKENEKSKSCSINLPKQELGKENKNLINFMNLLNLITFYLKLNFLTVYLFSKTFL